MRRPNNYDINVAVMLGPTDPDPTMDVSNLDIVKTVVQDSPHKLFIGGLPCDWTEDQVRMHMTATATACRSLQTGIICRACCNQADSIAV